MCNIYDSSGRSSVEEMDDMEPELWMHHRILFGQREVGLRHRYADDTRRVNGWPVSGLQVGRPLPQQVKVELHNRKLWEKFRTETTEMIITKLGRRMFPSMQLEVSGLERGSRYCILLEVAPASRHRHKYVGTNSGNIPTRATAAGRSGWMSAGPAEPQSRLERRIYLHPDSPATGDHWMQHPISFGKLKLTNNAADHRNNVVLTSMHKYLPRIWIVRCDDASNVVDFYAHPASSFTFDETEFIAVTAYQNENITKLKIDNNPFAKGFRESGQSRCKRKLERLKELPTVSCKKDRHEEKEKQEQGEKENGGLGYFELEGNSLERTRKSLSVDDSVVSEAASTRLCLHRPWTTENVPSSRPALPLRFNRCSSSIPFSNFLPPSPHIRSTSLPCAMLSDDSSLSAYVRFFYPFFLNSHLAELQRYHQPITPFAKFH